jgi:YVTN family beta-propeller protein
VVDETSSSTDRLQFRMLGALQASRNGATLQLGGRQQRAVLALLVAEAGSTVSLDRLADALWGEHVPAGYVATLQTYVFHLREVLEPGRGKGAPAQVLLTRPNGYALHASDSVVDAVEFEQLAGAGHEALARYDYADASQLLSRALALWRGEVLADLAGYDFVAPIAARLSEERLTALEDRVDADLALGRHAVLVGELDQFVDQYPLRERLHRQRMLALYRCGRQSDALAAYQSLHKKLDDEIGVQPSAPLRELHRAILAHDEYLDWHPTEDPAQPTTELRAPGATSQRGRLSRRWVVATCGLAILTAAGTISAVIVTHTPRHSLAALPGNGVGAIHPDGSLHDAVQTGTNPDAIAHGAGALWVANAADGTVTRVDPRSHPGVVQTIRVGAQPAAITVTGQDVWVANHGDGTVSRINARSNTVTQTINVGTQPDAITSGSTGVWVGNRGDETLQRIDPNTGDASQPIAVGGPPDGIAVDGDTVWLTNAQDGTVTQLDPRTGEPVRSPIHADAGASAIAVTAHDVWVTNSLALSVTRIDRATGRVVDTIPVGDGPSSIVSAGHDVWVGDQYDGTVARIDPDHGHAVRKYAIGASPIGLTAVGGTVWVASAPFAARAHRGGTLRIVSYTLPGTWSGLDPANGYVGFSLAMERMVYDGLVAFHQASGVAGLTLVPDLATTLPILTDGGRTYTFTVRSGIRYSNGMKVHASDIYRGVQRELLASEYGNRSFFSGIKGGATCISHPALCERALHAGIEVNDTTGRIVFRLVAADPDFVYKLAYFAYATVSTAPRTPRHVLAAPLPGTGPYMIKTYRNNGKNDDSLLTSRLTLVRNPYFHQWSFAAQPDGYPNVIDWRFVAKASVAVDQVSSGKADVVWLPYPLTDTTTNTRLLQNLRLHYPAQLHNDKLLETDWAAYLNTHTPPFDNIAARQAINDAVDRNVLGKLVAGAQFARASCQMLPANMPDYKPYCPYSRGPYDGHYRGPDLAKARALVARSGTSRMPVTVWSHIPVGPGDSAGVVRAYIEGTLRQLGYRVSQHLLPNDTANGYVRAHSRQVQIYVNPGGWGADFPSPSNFYDEMASCHSRDNYNMYCDPALDRLADQALTLQGTDAGAARALWTRIDKGVTDNAPWIVTNTDGWSNLVSSRVQNYQSSGSPTPLPLYDLLWIR